MGLCYRPIEYKCKRGSGIIGGMERSIVASTDAKGCPTRPRSIINASTVLAVSFLLGCIPPEPQSSAHQRDSQTGLQPIAARLLLDRKTFSVGETINAAVEISNQTRQPVVISNVVTIAGDSSGHIQFKLTDAAGKEFPSATLITDSFSRSYVPENSWSSVLGRWLVLYPGYSIKATLQVDKTLFSILDTPGKYKLQAAYSSGGLSYPANYHQLGITDRDVAALRYSSWSGKILTNSVWITIVPPKGPKNSDKK